MARYPRQRYTYKRPARRRARIRYGRLIAMVAALLLLAGGIWGGVFYARLQRDLQKYPDAFQEGLSVDGVALEGRAYDDARAELMAQYEDLLTSSATLRFEGREWTIGAAELQCSVDVDEVLAEAWAYGRTGESLERQAQIQALRETPVELNVTLRYDLSAIHEFVAAIKAEVDRLPTDATMSVDGGGGFSYTPSSVGYSLDAESLIPQIADAILSGDGAVIDLAPQILEPEVSEDSLRACTQRIAVYATYFRGSSDNRIANIKRALDNFNGYIVAPGAKCSFNDVVGKRTRGRGYLEAPEFLSGEVVTGVGGGVCQASTTLYGALLRAGMEIVSRSPHSLVVSYVNPSEDATVSDKSGKDLVFKNTSDYPIYIYTSVNKTKGRATVTVYGKPIGENVEVRIESEVVQGNIQGETKYVEDETGEHVWFKDEILLKSTGKTGTRSRAFRVYINTETGEEIKRELLSTDYYAPQADVYWVGVHEY